MSDAHDTKKETELVDASMRAADRAARTHSLDELIEQAAAHAANKLAIVPPQRSLGFGPFELKKNVEKWHVRPDGTLARLVFEASVTPEGRTFPTHDPHYEVIVGKQTYRVETAHCLDSAKRSFHFDDHGFHVFTRFAEDDDRINVYGKVMGFDKPALAPYNLVRVLFTSDDCRFNDQGAMMAIFDRGKGYCCVMTTPGGNHGNEDTSVWCPPIPKRQWRPGHGNDIIYWKRKFIYRMPAPTNRSVYHDVQPVIRLPKGFTGEFQPVKDGCYVEVEANERRYVEFHAWQTPAEIARPPRLIRDLATYDQSETGFLPTARPRLDIARSLNYGSAMLTAWAAISAYSWLFWLMLRHLNSASITPVLAALTLTMAFIFRTSANQLVWRQAMGDREEREAIAQLTSGDDATAVLTTALVPDLTKVVHDLLLAEPRAALEKLFETAKPRLDRLKAEEIEALSLATQNEEAAKRFPNQAMAKPTTALAEFARDNAKRCRTAIQAVTEHLGKVKARFETFETEVIGGAATIAMNQRLAAQDERITAECRMLYEGIVTHTSDFQDSLGSSRQYVAAWNRGQLDAADASAEQGDTPADFTVRVLVSQQRGILDAPPEDSQLSLKEMTA